MVRESPDRSKTGRLRAAANALLHGLFALALLLCAGELLVRALIAGPSPQIYDPVIGYSYGPYAELFQAKEGRTRLRFNALGLNDDDITPKNGRCRVLVLGDSYTAALQVPPAQNFSSVAEQLESRLDVVNGGRDGLFLGDLHKVAKRLARDVSPDLVVYVVSKRSVDDDIHVADFSVVVDPATGVVTDAVMRVEGKEALKQLFAPILHESALATRLAGQLQPAVVDALKQLRTWSQWVVPGAAAAARGPETPAARPSNEDVLAFVFRRLASDGPAALLYVDALTYLPNNGAKVAAPSHKAEVIARSAAARAGVRFFTTSDYLIASMQKDGKPPFGFDNAVLPGGHLNPTGHRAVGQALLDLVRTMSPTLPTECSAK
jgi:hypothetical protein